MVRAIDVGQWLIERHENRALHMQKLPYFGQVWSLVWTGQPLIDDEFEAWPKGPVSPDLWRSCRYDRPRSSSPIPGANSAALGSGGVAIMEAMEAFYGPMVGDTLVSLSHDAAWTAARGNLPPGAYSTEWIDLTLAVREYSRKALTSSSVPIRPAGLASRNFSAAEISREATKQDLRWANTHERLASA